ncbi:MAG: helix-turn-helix transcriptional regulator [Hyphomicrobiales bacterium]|nr:helix-turn-helix transcriptional regulator [Hyphomicrobiales bacterium]
MTETKQAYLTTKELADLLRIKERKVYDLAAAGAVPCVRVVGKLLFPRAEIEAWIAEHGSGPAVATGRSRPSVVLGSHDPLLDWAIRESGCGCSTLFDGSGDGLDRFARAEGIAAGLHLRGAETEDWNVPAVRNRFAGEPVVLVEFAWRERGLLFRRDEADAFPGMEAIAGRRLVNRQPGSGGQVLLEAMLAEQALATPPLAATGPAARDETEAGLAVLEGRGDVAMGLAATARQLHLGFTPLLKERFDLLVDRRAWFEPPFQTLFRFLGSPALAERAKALGGYDLSGFGTVHFNGS